jgi:hypothetical protein
MTERDTYPAGVPCAGPTRVSVVSDPKGASFSVSEYTPPE